MTFVFGFFWDDENGIRDCIRDLKIRNLERDNYVILIAGIDCNFLYYPKLRCRSVVKFNTRNFTKSVRACVDQLLTIRLLTTNGADPRDNPTRKSRDCVAQKLSSYMKPGNLILSAFIQSMQPRKRFLVRSTIDKSPLHFPLFPFSPPLASSLSLSLFLAGERPIQ